MSKHLKFFVLSAALYAFGSGLAIAATKDQWEEEILIQLSELRKAQGELVKQVADLKTEIQTLHASAGPQPAAALSFDLRNNDFPVLGDRKAEVAIVEFSDFECPYCGRHQKNTIPALVDKYVNGGKVKYVFVAYPLGFHSHAESAAVAAACAGKQNAFWKMHDLLFENQNVLSEQLFLKLASDLKLKDDQFASCLHDPKVGERIRANVALGDSVGVQGTPAFLIGRIRNGVLTDVKAVSGAQPMASFERILDSLLAASGGKGAP